MDSFIFGYILFISTQFIREFILRKGTEAKSFHLGKVDKLSSVLTASYIIFFCILPIFLKYYNASFLNEYQKMGIVGVIIMILGMIIHFLSVITLGRYFTRTLAITNNHSVVRSGIYRLIRHPGYLGTILIGVGFGITSYNWILFTFIISFLVLIYSYRIYAEEKMMLEQFGNEYKEYMKESWRLIPYVL